jgi:hypothetical protein
MIIYYLFIALLNIIGFILLPLQYLPDVALPDMITTSISVVSAAIYLAVAEVPLTLAALFASLAAIIVAELNISAYKIIKWIYNKIPGVN